MVTDELAIVMWSGLRTCDLDQKWEVSTCVCLRVARVYVVYVAGCGETTTPTSQA